MMWLTPDALSTIMQSSITTQKGIAMTTLIRANLSRFHPDSGMTPAEHEERKAKRAAGKVKFIPKADIRAKFFGKTKRR